MNNRPPTYPLGDTSRLVTDLVRRRKRGLLDGAACVPVRDRATPLNLSDPYPFDRALRAHMQAVLSQRESCSCM